MILLITLVLVEQLSIDYCKEIPDILERYKKGRTKVKSLIAGRLIQKATEGDTASQIFYLKTQCGWKETQSLEHSSPDGSMTPTKIERIIVDKSTNSNS
tara:strand:+ start:757 stop:1053 length:297 start_codon:yes stop_codon:yes gene_type:complete